MSIMNGFFNIKNPDTFLGGQNVHNLLLLAGVGYIVYRLWK